jgi:hypothetical protein
MQFCSYLYWKTRKCEAFKEELKHSCEHVRKNIVPHIPAHAGLLSTESKESRGERDMASGSIV